MKCLIMIQIRVACIKLIKKGLNMIQVIDLTYLHLYLINCNKCKLLLMIKTENINSHCNILNRKNCKHGPIVSVLKDVN